MDQALHMHMVPATDVAAPRRFYVDALGWTIWGATCPARMPEGGLAFPAA